MQAAHPSPMTAPVHVDGSQGEGGGQIVRSSLALALVTGRSLVVDNIRARRRKPGLMPQHLAAVHAAKRVCSGDIQGAEIGSACLRFEPHHVRGGDYSFDVGTAGSTTLVLQTVLPALLIADAPSTVVIEGGTHNPWAPPFDFLQQAFLPLVCRMGPRVTMTLSRHGFYPAGGGQLIVKIEPCPRLAGFDLLERGALRSCITRAWSPISLPTLQSAKCRPSSAKWTGTRIAAGSKKWTPSAPATWYLSSWPPSTSPRSLARSAAEVFEPSGWPRKLFSRPGTIFTPTLPSALIWPIKSCCRWASVLGSRAMVCVSEAVRFGLCH